ncbi:MAG: hypothetical protein ACREQQ_07820, partial [Candidatus Binatia bacterium]
QLDKADLDAALRKELESARRKAFAGRLTDREFRALQRRGVQKVTTLRSLLSRTRALRKVAARVANLPPKALLAYDEAIRAIEATLASTRSIARLAGLRRSTLAHLADHARRSVVV